MSLCSLAMMYIFRWGMIHSAIASIYNCHWPTWVRQADVAQEADGESDSLFNRDAVFLISFTNHFPSNGSYLQSLRPLPRCLLLPLTPPPHTHLPATLFLLLLLFFLLSAAQRQLWKRKMAPSQRRAKQQPALLEFLLNFLSMTTPGWQPTHPQIFCPFFSLPPLYEDHMCCIIITFCVYISLLAHKPSQPFFCNTYCSYAHVWFTTKIVEDLINVLWTSNYFTFLFHLTN